MRLQTLAIILPLLLAANAAHAQYTYTGPVVARQSGITCRGVDGQTDATQFYRDASGIGYSSPSPTAVFCPITRRNAEPYGLSSGGFLGDTVVNLGTLDVYILQYSPTNVSCQAYGTGNVTGSQIISPPIFTCASNPTGGCASSSAPFDTPNSVSLHFVDPLSGAHTGQGMVNIGFSCNLPGNQDIYILGSVAQFPTY